MSKITFSMPGKIGDALLQWPVAYQFCKATGQQCDLWLDQGSLRPLENLFRAQPCVREILFKPGVENYSRGGQPFHMEWSADPDHVGRTMYHLGLRHFPERQITLETLENVHLPIEIDKDALASECSLEVGPAEPKNRVVIHGQGVCPHTRATPQMWRFLSLIAPELEQEFDEQVFVGSADDRQAGFSAYPDWTDFDDGGDFLTLANLIAGSRLVIGTGSCIAALGSVLKVPTIRVHDPIGQYAKVIWSGLGDNQINETEVALRKSWPGFKRQFAPAVALDDHSG